MQIPKNKIHNVRKIYSKKKSQSRVIEQKKDIAKSTNSDKINISAEGKRQAIIEKVATDIVEHITNSGPKDEIEQEIINKLEDEIGQSIDFKANQGENGGYQNNEFIFNIIDGNNEKMTTTLHVNDTSFLIKRLEQLAKEAVDKNMVL